MFDTINDIISPFSAKILVLPVKLALGKNEIKLRQGAADKVELAAEWTPSVDVAYVKDIYIPLKQLGAIAAGKIVQLRIESDNAGLPSGTVLGTSETILCSAIKSSYAQWLKFIFTTHVQVNAAVHLILSGDYDPSAVNCIVWLSTTVAAGGNQEVKDGMWANVGTKDFSVDVRGWDENSMGFSEPAVYTPDGGAAKEISVNFDFLYSMTELGGMAANNKAPIADCSTSDLTGVNNKATLQVRGIVYKILRVEPDSEGMTRLILTVD